ncbi:hypothetical protein E1B28_007210 [Marasmius oreades]|uniref:F-box protein n=1 Tax=Marasmius oreades TaxID=181124 RepID=A0A9P7S195_9AGAR|nr:uncharacterized protein E1B28_007210 [Marasmius oreades]KAG7093539.1 hypothetical protein E1B28_007210 [Marasmius oreades]
MLRTLSRTRSQTQTTSRRNSARHHPSILITAVGSPTHRQRNPTLRFPPEILDRIVDLAILSAFAQAVDPFASISSFSLASTHFRRISLRRYLLRVNLRSRKHFIWLFEMARKHGIRNHGQCGLVDIRSLSTSAGFITSEAPKLSYLVNLLDLDISFATEGPTTQHTCISIIFKKLLTLSPNCSSSLTKLSLTFLSRLDISLLRLISSSFPLLSHLHLSAADNVDDYDVKDICWCCFEELLSCSYYSPIPHMFSDARDLATAYGQALQPLAHLKQIHLGIYLSNEELWWNHISCCKADSIIEPGECKKCREVYSPTTLVREQTASTLIAAKLPSLKVISWNSYFKIRKETKTVRDIYSRRLHFDIREDGAVIRRRSD